MSRTVFPFSVAFACLMGAGAWSSVSAVGCTEVSLADQFCEKQCACEKCDVKQCAVATEAVRGTQEDPAGFDSQVANFVASGQCKDGKFGIVDENGSIKPFDPTVKPIDNLAPEFPEGTGQDLRGRLAYPAGPFGVGQNSIIPNFKFLGFPNPKPPAEHTTANRTAFRKELEGSGQLKSVELAHFYNPDGKSVFPQDGFRPGEKKPKAILIVLAARWCGPCNEEASTILPGKYAQYQPRGGEFLVQLADGSTPGIVANQTDLAFWTSKYWLNYPGTIDPSRKLGSLFSTDAFPANFIVETKSMKLLAAVSGHPDASFWSQYEALLDPAQ